MRLNYFYINLNKFINILFILNYLKLFKILYNEKIV